MREGVRLGLDVGRARTGVAYCDRQGTLASTYTTINTGDVPQIIAQVKALIAESDAMEVIVGLPTLLSGRNAQAAAYIKQVANQLAHQIAPVGVRLYDERLSTVQAHKVLATSGKNAKQRKTMVDSVAAMLILQSALDYEQRTGAPAGEAVPVSTKTEGQAP